MIDNSEKLQKLENIKKTCQEIINFIPQLEKIFECPKGNSCKCKTDNLSELDKNSFSNWLMKKVYAYDKKIDYSSVNLEIEITQNYLNIVLAKLKFCLEKIKESK